MRPEFDRCTDPGCAGIAELDTDGEIGFYDCQICGYTFGWHITRERIIPKSDGACAVGITEAVRRAASAPASTHLGTTPLLQIGRRPHGRDSPA